MILTSQMKFDLGRLVITPAALESIPADDICNAINRHICGDFGDLDDADRRENELALRAWNQAVMPKSASLDGCLVSVTSIVFYPY